MPQELPMEIDKTLILPAPPQRVWALLLDPQAIMNPGKLFQT